MVCLLCFCRLNIFMRLATLTLGKSKPSVNLTLSHSSLLNSGPKIVYKNVLNPSILQPVRMIPYLVTAFIMYDWWIDDWLWIWLVGRWLLISWKTTFELLSMKYLHICIQVVRALVCIYTSMAGVETCLPFQHQLHGHYVVELSFFSQSSETSGCARPGLELHVCSKAF